MEALFHMIIINALKENQDIILYIFSVSYIIQNISQMLTIEKL